MDVIAEKARILQKLTFHNSDISSCDFDHDCRLITGSSDKNVAVWDWTMRVGFVQLPYSPVLKSKYRVSDVKFLPNLKEFAMASFDGCISLFDIQTGSCIHTFMHSNLVGVRNICYIREGNYLISAGDDGSLCVWNVQAKILVGSVMIHEESVTTVCASPDGKIILSGDTTGVAKIWNFVSLLEEKAPVPLNHIPDCHDLGVNGADFSTKFEITKIGEEYMLGTCGNDNMVKIWRITLSENSMELECRVENVIVLSKHGSAVNCIKFHPSGTLLASASTDKTTRIWKVGYDFRCLKVLEGHARYVTTCTFSRDGCLLATGSNDKSVLLWDLTGKLELDSCLNTGAVEFIQMRKKETRPGKLWQKLENLGNALNSCCFSRTNLLAAAGTDKLLRLWHQADDGKFVQVSASPLSFHAYPINQLDFNELGTELASCSVDGTTAIWNMMMTSPEYNVRGVVHGMDGCMKACRISPDGKFLATGGDNQLVSIWQMADLHSVSDMNGHAGSVTCLSFSHDSEYLVSGCEDGSFRFWSFYPCGCAAFWENAHDMGVNSVDFSKIPPDGGNYLLVTCGNDSQIKMWSILAGDEKTKAVVTFLKTLSGHGGDITCVRFQPQSKEYLASAATDKTVRIWAWEVGVCLHIFDAEQVLTCCAFSFDADFIAAGTLDKSLIIWNLRDEQLQIDDARCLAKESNWEENDIPHEYICPITHELMKEPVWCTDGYNYERSAIESWFSSGKITSPMTNEPISNIRLRHNEQLSEKINNFASNQSN